uniref:guanine nucleotide exchange factor for Rab-3A isoform X3 n=1 Tax=Callithrix jacchus TaxID=9483 RepID=UPI0023DCECE7|nr:guanine nucleotide exchange factor for Rab-3A isoform X3 [Callithrix jacchus]
MPRGVLCLYSVLSFHPATSLLCILARSPSSLDLRGLTWSPDGGAHPCNIVPSLHPPQPDQGLPPSLAAVPVSWKSTGPCQGHRESPGALVETSAGEVAQDQEGPVATQLDVLRLRSSSMEIREKGSEFLKEELRRAQKELKLKDEECERLSKVREQLEQELEELTASLFEEAHKMVREANMKQAASEKQLKEARGKIDMLQAEVTALKTLVITSTPASPNRELHPQLLSPTKTGPRKGHSRHKSTSSTLCPTVCPAAGHTLTPDREGKEPGLPPLLSLLLCVVPSKAVHLTYEPAWPLPPGEPLAPACTPSPSFSRQVDTILFAEFQTWRESPTLDKTCPFLERVYREDVGPCLDFTMQEHVCAERADPYLPPPNPARGLQKPLLHLTIFPGQDHCSVQLLHLHPVHPARPGPAGRRAHVLGDHAAAEGDVPGQARLLPPGGLGRSPGPEGALRWSQHPPQSEQTRREPEAEQMDRQTAEAALSRHHMSILGQTEGRMGLDFMGRPLSLPNWVLPPPGGFQESTKDQGAWIHTRGSSALGRGHLRQPASPSPVPRTTCRCLVASMSSERDCMGGWISGVPSAQAAKPWASSAPLWLSRALFSVASLLDC